MRESPDPYCYPGTSILKNLGNHRNKKALEAFEKQIVAFNIQDLDITPIQEPFGKERLRETHRRLFDGVYVWAGQFRENIGRMTKYRNGHEVTYGEGRFIDGELDRLFHTLKTENNLKGLSQDHFAERAAYYYGEIDAVHPFRDGNSRTLRRFLADLGKETGYRFQWSKTNTDDTARQRLYNARDVAVANADHGPLAAIFAEVLSPVKDISKKKEQDWGLGF